MARGRRSRAGWRTTARATGSSGGGASGRSSTSVKLPGVTLTWTVTARPGRLPQASVSARSSSRT